MSEAEIAEAKVKFRKTMDQDLLDNPLYSKRIQIEPKPEFVVPPRLFIIPEHNQKFRYIPSFYQRASFIFSLGLVIGILLGKVL
ncbi:hypothetical protein [Acinetobacter sp. CFCC 10889]|uniref:hypothetical protein n=1 Tax=Acinetobacter sp. CFCC 10889 TaxID=1775557 RepID=UPI0013A6B4F0|nr:hypothetical protein [Acinetobacter sp. CFCC 10889]